MDHALLPAWVTLERITAERKELYSAVLLTGETIPISVPPSQIDDSVPTEEEVEWAVCILRGHRSGCPSWMRSEHLQEWLQEHREAEEAM